VLARLRGHRADESDVTLTEKWVDEIIGHDRFVRKINIILRTREQFTMYLEFYIKIYVGKRAAVNEILLIVLIHVGNGFLCGLYRWSVRVVRSFWYN